MYSDNDRYIAESDVEPERDYEYDYGDEPDYEQMVALREEEALASYLAKNGL